MKKTSAALLLTGFALHAVALASDAPPQAYPKLDKENTTLAVVVANVSNAANLPESEECRTGSRTAPDGKVSVVWCLHSPLYFKAEILATLYGKVPAATLYVSTTSHWGTARVDNARSPVLITLHTDGKHTVMPAYAMQNLVADTSGELYLIQRTHQASVHCSTPEMRQPIAALELPVQDVIPEERIAVYDKAHVDEFLLRVEGGYRPRYALSMTRLRAHLEQFKPGPDTPCPK